MSLFCMRLNEVEIIYYGRWYLTFALSVAYLTVDVLDPFVLNLMTI